MPAVDRFALKTSFFYLYGFESCTLNHTEVHLMNTELVYIHDDIYPLHIHRTQSSLSSNYCLTQIATPNSTTF